MPIFSVVVPLYNKEPYIARALRSVLLQTVGDFEAIVVDDGSTDDGAAVVESFDDPRVRLVRQTNKGVSAARNRGILESLGGLIAFLDADDEWMPAFLETVLSLQQKYPLAGAYATDYYTQEKKQRLPMKQKILPPEPWEGPIPRYFFTAIHGDPVSSSSVCIPRKTFEKVGLFQEGVWWGEDLDMWGRIALTSPIVFTWYYGAIYHYEAMNRANERRVLVREHPFTRTGLQYIDRNRHLLDREGLSDLVEYIEKTKMQTASRALKAGEPAIARELIRTCTSRTLRSKMIAIYLISYLPGDLYHTLRTIRHRLLR